MKVIIEKKITVGIPYKRFSGFFLQNSFGISSKNRLTDSSKGDTMRNALLLLMG